MVGVWIDPVMAQLMMILDKVFPPIGPATIVAGWPEQGNRKIV